MEGEQQQGPLLGADLCTDTLGLAALVEQGVAAKTAFRYPESESLLGQAWDALRKSPVSKQAISVGEQLGELLCLHLSRFEQAEAVFRQCCELQTRLDPTPEEVLRLDLWLAKVCFYSGRYKEAELACRRALVTFSESSQEAEVGWNAVFYLFYALCRQEQSEAAQALFAQWEAKPLRGENETTTVMQLQLKALVLRMQGNPQQAEKVHLQVMHTCSAHCPNSVYAAINLMTLGILYHVDMGQLEAAEVHYLASERIYAVHFPQSLNRAKNFCNLAVLYSDLEHFDQAEHMRVEAHTVLSAHYAGSIDVLKNVKDLAVLYTDAGRVEDAIRKRLDLHELYVAHHPGMLEAGLNLCHLAELYEQINRQAEAETQRLAAEELFYRVHHPSSSQRADNLMNLGILYYKLNRRKQAEHQHALADQIYSEFYPTSADTAVNLLNWGVVYHNTGRLKEAEGKYLAAHRIYEEHHPLTNNAALNAFNLGLLYETMGEQEAALRMVTQAVDVWTRNESEEAKSRGLPEMWKLQKIVNRK